MKAGKLSCPFQLLVCLASNVCFFPLMDVRSPFSYKKGTHFETDSKQVLRKDRDVVCKCHISGDATVQTEGSASNPKSLVSACVMVEPRL